MKSLFKTLLFAVLMIAASTSFAQQTISLDRSQDRFAILEDQMQGLRLSVNYAQLQSSRLEQSRGSFYELSLEGGAFDGSVGDPKLPVTQRLIEIPFGAEVNVQVLGYHTEEYDLADYGVGQLMPMQAPVSKNDIPEEAPFVINEATYSRDEFLGQPLAQVEVLGTLRGYRLAKLVLSPVSYNPVQNKIRVCNDIDVQLRFTGADEALTREVKAKTRSPYFDFIQDRLLNAAVSRDYPGHPDMTQYPVTYVIIADRMFDGYLEDFIRWKTQKGFKVVLAYTDEIGTTLGAIQAYIHGLYNNATVDNPAPSFILFVGDTPQIPAYIGTSSQKVTDVYYASVDGDYFPEMYYGRFSARSVGELLPQIEKTLYYEQYQFVDPSYLNRVNLIAGWDDYWNQQIAQPTIRYGMNNWFNEDHGYTDVYPYYGPSDYAGCYQNDKISVGMINYTAHCSETVWGTPALSASNIYSMSNEGFYPLAIGNCCESSQFGYGDCVGEAWVRADKKGAVCYLGSAPSTYWYEDAWWAMGSYHITEGNMGQAPQYSQTTMGSYDAMHEGGYVSTGGLVYCGNLAVTESCNHGWSDAAHYYWEAYNVLGDPSLVCYHTEGVINTLSHEPVLFKGSNHFSLEAEPGSMVCLSKDGVQLGSGMVGDDGSLTLEVSPVNEGGFVDLVVTKPQRIPVIQCVPVATPGQPYLVVDEVGPMHFPYNQETMLSVTVKNAGTVEMPANTTVELQSLDEKIQVVDGQCLLTQPIPAGGTVVVNNAFKVKADAEVRDGERFRLLTQADCGEQVNSDFYVTVDKPVLEYVGYEGDHGFVAGGWYELWVTFKNVGGAAAESPVARLVSTNPSLQIPTLETHLDRLEAGEETTCSLSFRLPDDVSEGDELSFEVSLQDVGVSVRQNITIVNRCAMELELRDAGGNGWEGAQLRVNFQDGTPVTYYELQDGASNIYQLASRKGYKIKLTWINGNNDAECSFTLRFDDGEVLYESTPDLHGTLLLTEVDCAIHNVGLQESHDDTMTRVFPNPASGQVNVVAESPILHCQMVNSLGQVVVDKRFYETETHLNVNGLVPGIYLLRVNTEAGESFHKIMIK